MSSRDDPEWVVDRAWAAIPGPDPGACDHCGVWRKAGIEHDCSVEIERLEAEIERLCVAAKGDEMEANITKGRVERLEAALDAARAEVERLREEIRLTRAGAPIPFKPLAVREAEAEVERLREALRRAWEFIGTDAHYMTAEDEQFIRATLNR